MRRDYDRRNGRQEQMTKGYLRGKSAVHFFVYILDFGSSQCQVVISPEDRDNNSHSKI